MTGTKMIFNHTNSTRILWDTCAVFSLVPVIKHLHSENQCFIFRWLVLPMSTSAGSGVYSLGLELLTHNHLTCAGPVRSHWATHFTSNGKICYCRPLVPAARCWPWVNSMGLVRYYDTVRSAPGTWCKWGPCSREVLQQTSTIIGILDNLAACALVPGCYIHTGKKHSIADRLFNHITDSW